MTTIILGHKIGQYGVISTPYNGSILAKSNIRGTLPTARENKINGVIEFIIIIIIIFCAEARGGGSLDTDHTSLATEMNS